MLEPMLMIAALISGQFGEALPAKESTTTLSLQDYQVAQVQRVDVASGKTRVAVETNAPSPRSGSFPVRFFIDNTQGPRQPITLGITAPVGGGSHKVTRTLEIEAGERRVVNVPVPSEMRYGQISASGPGIGENSNASMYFQGTYDPQKVVLSLSRPEDFEKLIGKPPKYSGANVYVHPIPPAEAPGELASYLGYDAVVVPDTATLDQGLDETQRRALEAYVASGGTLVLSGLPRSPALLPLVSVLKAGANVYGFGRVLIAGPDDAATMTVFRETSIVSPHGALPEYERRYNTGWVNDLLLPQATAPLGRFLFIIALFTLAIGPGSVWVARRRGPAALLVTIPGTAIITCVLIIGYSLIADGFTVHTAAYGFTVLDAKEHRAITQGVTAYYANLAPSKVSFGPGIAIVAPWEDRRDKYIADMRWQDGLALGGDFVPSRSYREWGFVSIEPSRARVVLKHNDSGYVLQNALGMEIDRVMVNVDGTFFSAGPIDDGSESKAESGNLLLYASSKGSTRFPAAVVRAVAQAPLKHGQFLAHVKGAGFVPTGGIRSQLHDGEQWVRGEVEE